MSRKDNNAPYDPAQEPENIPQPKQGKSPKAPKVRKPSKKGK